MKKIQNRVTNILSHCECAEEVLCAGPKGNDSLNTNKGAWQKSPTKSM